MTVNTLTMILSQNQLHPKALKVYLNVLNTVITSAEFQKAVEVLVESLHPAQLQGRLPIWV